MDSIGLIHAMNIILFLPSMTIATLGIGGRYIGKYGVSILSVHCSVVLILLTSSIWFNIYYACATHTIEYFKWMGVGKIIINWVVCIDPLSVSMLLIIEIISSCVIIYSIEYMGNDAHFIRSIFFLPNPVFFMLILVTSGNLFQLLIGWEGVGLISFLLVNFWFTRLEANRSAVKAMVFNRIGDVGLIGACCLLLSIFKTTDFSYIYLFDNNLYMREFVIDNELQFGLNLPSLPLLSAAMGKSAQLGLHAWLPDAMEGPTPVSASLHSATMVTAGVFSLLRFSPISYYTPITMNIITLSGGATAFIAGLFAFFQMDLKKIIAYSTCSQLGSMLASYGMYNPMGCLFHLITHAFFKASLFSTAGSIIHTIDNEQDIRRMGGLLNYMPLTFPCMMIGFAGSTGFPFPSGSYSKDYILFYSHNYDSSISVIISSSLIILSSFLTIGYSIKVLYRVFIAPNSFMFRTRIQGVIDSGVYMNLALFTPALPTILCGYSIKVSYSEQSFLFSAGFWGGIFSNYCQEPFFVHEIEFISVSLKSISISSSVIGFLIHRSLYGIRESFYIFYIEYLSRGVCNTYAGLIYKAAIFRAAYTGIVKILYYVSFKWFLEIIDRGFLEKLGSLGLVEVLDKLYHRVVDLHKNEGSFVGSLSNFWFIIYFSILLYAKLMSHSTILGFTVNILIIRSSIHYTELVWKAVGLKT